VLLKAILIPATKKLVKLAWRLLIDWYVNIYCLPRADPDWKNDSHRTLVPLKYPPHVVALGSLYVATLLSSFEQPTSPHQPGHRSSHEIAATLSTEGNWEGDFQAKVEDLEGISPDPVKEMHSRSRFSLLLRNCSCHH
jgi:CTD kinase subunit beta